MRILHFPSNTGNHPLGLVRAEQQRGFESDLVLVETNPYYPDQKGLVAPGASTLRRWWARIRYARTVIRDYDVVHFNKGETFLPGSLPFVFDLWWLKRRGKKSIVTFQGSDARPQVPGAPSTRGLPDRITNLIKRIRIAQIVRWADATFCLNPDLLEHVPGATFMPYASVDPAVLRPDGRPRSNGPLRVVHAPTNRQLKGTQLVIHAVERARESIDIDLDIVEGRPHSEVIERVRCADVAVDQLVLGWYGGFAVECMALGTPVMAWLDPAQLAAAPSDFVAELPVINTPANALAAALIRTASDLDLSEAASQSRRFVERWHDPAQLVEQCLD